MDYETGAKLCFGDGLELKKCSGQTEGVLSRAINTQP